MACSYDGCKTPHSHNIRTCPWRSPRKSFSREAHVGRRCECCGRYGYELHTHHARGRADNSDSSALRMCAGADGCHLNCGHEGHFGNAALKPRVCRVLKRDAHWRS